MSSVWAPPTAQQYPARSYQPVDVLMDRIRKLEGLVGELTKGSPLRQAGIGVAPGQVEFNGDAVFAGDTTIGGNLDVTGTLNLPAGIIGNDALSEPATFGRNGGGATNIAIPAAAAAVVTAEISVPAGYSSALVMAVVTAGAINPTAAGAYLYVGARIQGVPPNVSVGYAEASRWAGATAHATRQLEGLAGGTIAIDAWVNNTSGSTWAAASSSRANIDAIAIFLR